MNIINVSGLRKKYGQLQAVDGISFSVGRGEIFALLGPNGSGKTTTLEILMGLRPHDGGSVTYLDAAGQAGRAPRIGAVFQGRVYYDNLTVRELIRYYSRLYRMPPQDIGRYLAKVNLQEKLETQFKHLSGGQKQQLSIILGLLNDPELVFLDEPSNALDPQVRLKIWELIRLLRDEGRTVVFTTHYIEEAEALADRVAILKKGQLVVTDSPANIVRQYNAHYMVEFSLEEAADAGALDAYGFGEVRLEHGVYSFRVEAIDGKLLQAMQDLSAKYRLSAINIGKSSLQSIFVQITEESFAS